MAEAIRQQILNLLPLIVDGSVHGVPWSSRQIETTTGFDWETVKYTIWNLRRAGAIVNVGGKHPTRCLWAKTVSLVADGRAGNVGRPRRLQQASRGMGVSGSSPAQLPILTPFHPGQASRAPSITTKRGTLQRRNKSQDV